MSPRVFLIVIDSDGLRCFGEDVEHVLSHFPRGTKDIEILEFIGNNGYFLISKDHKIRYKQNEIIALRQYKVGAFFIIGKTLGRWELVKLLINNWDAIKLTAKNQSKPFIYKIKSRGKIERHTF